jgi:hypothetical protein
VQKSKPEIYQTSLCFFLSLRLSLSLSLKKKLQTPTPKSLANFQDFSASARFFLLSFFLCNVHGSFSHCHKEEVDEHHRLLIWSEKKTPPKNIQNKTQTQTRKKKKKKDNLDQNNNAAKMLTN